MSASQNQDAKANLKALVNQLLETPDHSEQIVDLINQIHKILSEHSEISGDDKKMEHLAAIPTARGKALGLNHAANCLLDYHRTHKFLKAMVAVIQQKRKEFSNGPIKIFYAGCGPYAPFLSLIAPLYSPEDLQYSLLEINQGSMQVAKRLIKSLSLESFVDSYHVADAITFKVPNATDYHILFSETLDAVLYRECYVPILFNLLPQFNKEVQLIPENVLLDVSFASLKKDGEEVVDYAETHMATILDVRKEVASHKTDEAIPSKLPDTEVMAEKMERYDLMAIDTTVVIYNNIVLGRFESSLTIPLEMRIEQPMADARLIFTYQLEPSIELKYELQLINP